MSGQDERFDAVIVGGGFYGCAIAAYLSRRRRLRRILLVERERSLLSRASYNNQARVHNGYHYPRSFTTAYRSRINLPQFVRDWPSAIRQDFTKLYAIARRNSKVNARQFIRFCQEIGALLEPADPSLRQLFEPRLIEEVFLAREYAFDASELGRLAREELTECGIEVRLDTCAARVNPAAGRVLELGIRSLAGSQGVVMTRYLFNCTYSGLNQLFGDFPSTATGLKHEIAEMALMQVPAAMQKLGITVMDGPFFSVMPFPARKSHTLSHVRYTPHLHWTDCPGVDPYRKLDEYSRESRADRMLRDVCRYVPAMCEARYVESLFEVKTVLVKNEGDDGRPILIERHAALPGAYSILGGKIDNIFDVLEVLDNDHGIAR